jgi:hypothetical protein
MDVCIVPQGSSAAIQKSKRPGKLSRRLVDDALADVARCVESGDAEGAASSAKRATRQSRRLTRIEPKLQFYTAGDLGIDGCGDGEALPTFVVTRDQEDPTRNCGFTCPACNAPHWHSPDPVPGWRSAHCAMEDRVMMCGYFIVWQLPEGGAR